MPYDDGEETVFFESAKRISLYTRGQYRDEVRRYGFSMGEYLEFGLTWDFDLDSSGLKKAFALFLVTR